MLSTHVHMACLRLRRPLRWEGSEHIEPPPAPNRRSRRSLAEKVTLDLLDESTPLVCTARAWSAIAYLSAPHEYVHTRRYTCRLHQLMSHDTTSHQGYETLVGPFNDHHSMPTCLYWVAGYTISSPTIYNLEPIRNLDHNRID